MLLFQQTRAFRNILKMNSLNLLGIPVDRTFRFFYDRFQARDVVAEDSLKPFRHGERSYMGRKHCTVEKFALKKVEM